MYEWIEFYGNMQRFFIGLIKFPSILLTHFNPMFHFYTPLKTSENQSFQEV